MCGRNSAVTITHGKDNYKIIIYEILKAPLSSPNCHPYAIMA